MAPNCATILASVARASLNAWNCNGIFFPDDYWEWETPLLKQQVRKALKSRIMTVEYILQLKGFGILGQAKALNSLHRLSVLRQIKFELLLVGTIVSVSSVRVYAHNERLSSSQSLTKVSVTSQLAHSNQEIWTHLNAAFVGVPHIFGDVFSLVQGIFQLSRYVWSKYHDLRMEKIRNN